VRATAPMAPSVLLWNFAGGTPWRRGSGPLSWDKVRRSAAGGTRTHMPFTGNGF
jgi:hypothetical protein